MRKKHELAQAMRGEGALGRARDDEPVFVLRAQDKFSATLVELWANLVETEAVGTSTLTRDREEKIRNARMTARDMALWEPKKLSD